MQDSFVCENEFELDAQIENAIYKWITGENSQKITVSRNGIYWVEIAKGNCRFKDDAKITFSSINKFT